MRGPGRALALSCFGLAAAAALLGGASAATWYHVNPTGQASLDVTGASARPSLSGFALLALAAVAGLVAVAGPVRRAMGGLFAVAGGVVAVLATGDRFAGGAALSSPPPGLSADAL